MRLLLPLAALLLLPGLAAAQGSQIAVTPGEAPKTMDREAVRIDQKLGNQVPLDAAFRDRAGKAVTFGQQLEGRPSIVLPIFYECSGVCNLELRGSLEALKGLKSWTLGKDFNVVVVGIHPKEEPHLAQGKYESSVNELQKAGTENGWKFLVGDEPNIRKVTDALGFKYTYDERKNEIQHPSGIMFLTPDGRVSSYIYGATYTPEAFDKNLRVAARNIIGDRVEEIFFGCVMVDPITGRRSLVIRNVLKVAGVATVGVMGFSYLVLTGRARIRRRGA